jgi:hypothetical protein
MSVTRISKAEELLPSLYEIGTNKNRLPTELRGWVNVLELYVQLQYRDLLTTSIESLAAGGKYRKYFAATCDYPADRVGYGRTLVATMGGDFTNWKIGKYDQQVWERRFAHLVVPTWEIARYLFTPDVENAFRTYDVKEYTARWLPKLVNTVNRFNETGDWLGLYDVKCLTCGKDISFWTYVNSEDCPHCSGKVRNQQSP